MDDALTAGPPTDPAVAALLSTSRGPLGNDATNAAIRIAILGGQTPNRQDLAEHPFFVPDDFFSLDV